MTSGEHDGPSGDLSRRALLKGLGLGGASLAVSPMLSRTRASASRPDAVANDPAQVGVWSAPVALPAGAIGIHAVLLHTGKVLLWTGEAAGTVVYLFDPVTLTGVRRDLPDNVFCGGQTVLADGSALVVGGVLSAGPPEAGPTNCYLFDPVAESWAAGPRMRRGRWYPTVTTLPDGAAVVTGGYEEDGVTINPDLELFRPGTAAGAAPTMTVVGQLPPALVAYYAHQFVLPDSTVLILGHTQSAILHRSGWTLTALPSQPQASTGYNSGTLLPGGPGGSATALLAGGSYTGAGLASCQSLNARQSPPAWRRRAPLPQPRNNMNTVLLPDGTLLGVGGNSRGPTDLPQYQSLLYTPATDAWAGLASQAKRRAYHSTAVLLPDGRVLSAGDNRTGGGGNTVEFYSPPYLCRGPRPMIIGAPPRIGYRRTFLVETLDAVARVVLLSPGATTHSIDMHQRHVELTFTAAGGGVTATAPRSRSIAPPGWYMLFVLTATGVPSEAAWVRLG